MLYLVNTCMYYNNFIVRMMIIFINIMYVYMQQNNQQFQLLATVVMHIV